MSYLWTHRTSLNWVDLSLYWKRIEGYDREIRRLKVDDPDRNFNRNRNLLGKAGEFAYAITMDTRLPSLWIDPHGNDGGVDFEDGRVDVKSTEFNKGYTYCYDLFYPAQRHPTAELLVLAAVDLEGQRAALLGKISSDDFAWKSKWRADVPHPAFAVPESELNWPIRWSQGDAVEQLRQTCKELAAALSAIDYLCGRPNPDHLSAYDLHFNEQLVVEAVKRKLAEGRRNP